MIIFQMKFFYVIKSMISIDRIGRPIGRLNRIHLNRTPKNLDIARIKLQNLQITFEKIYHQAGPQAGMEGFDSQKSYYDVLSLWRYYDQELKTIYDLVLNHQINQIICSSTMAYQIYEIWNQLFMQTKHVICILMPLFHLEFKQEITNPDGTKEIRQAGLGRKNQEFQELLDLFHQRVQILKLDQSIYNHIYDLYIEYISNDDVRLNLEKLKDHLSIIKLTAFWELWMKVYITKNEDYFQLLIQDLNLDQSLERLNTVFQKMKRLTELHLSYKLKLERMPGDTSNQSNTLFNEELIQENLFQTDDIELINQQICRCIISKIINKYGNQIYKDCKYDTMQFIYKISYNKQQIIDLFSGFIDQRLTDITDERKKDDNDHIKLDDHLTLDVLIEIYNQCHNFCIKSFSNDLDVLRVLSSKFKTFINQIHNIELEFSNYIDKLIHSANSQEITNLDLRFINIINLFNFVQEKDMTLHYLSLKLQKRLIQTDQTSDLMIEQQFISLLKLKFGYSFPLRMENMIKDIILSEKINQELSSYINLHEKVKTKCVIEDDEDNDDLIMKSTGSSGLNLDSICLKVLSTNNWPITTYTGIPIDLPSELSSIITILIQNYNVMTNGKILNFQYFHGNGIINYQSAYKRYEIQVSTMQMIVLLLFNKSMCYTESDLLKNLGYDVKTDEYALTRKQMQEIIMPLCTPKCQILFKNKDEGSGITYSLNQNFKSDKIRIKLPNLILKDKDQNVHSITDDEKRKMIEERKYIIRANIVRIVKTRREINLQELIVEVIKFVSMRFDFPDLPKFIEVQADILIEQENIFYNDSTDKYQYEDTM